MNLLQLGLDVSSFDAQKEATLNKFIAIFDKLSMYDGKNIKPINISGLSKMNKSISETNKILLELNSRFDALSKLNPFQSQAVSAQKLQSTLSTTAKQMVAVSNGSSSATKSNTLKQQANKRA
ncbi:MAG: hypothetical protein IPI98_02655 [Chitinophagaceae bacterium]|nr:hypothetical protein [Chitinophagaceae bacterium]